MFSAEYRRSGVPWSPLVRSTLAAVAAALACYGLADLAGDDLLVVGRGEGPVRVPAGAVVVAVVAGGAGAALLVAVARRTRRPRRTFLLLCATGFALSTVPPVLGAQDGATLAWLLAMHVVAALAIVPAVARRLARHREDPRPAAAGPPGGVRTAR